VGGERNSVFWWETEPVVPGPPLEGTERADVCIVGGGYTGMWTAYFLKRADPSLDIAIVERSWAGSGASGHNDGYAMTLLDMSHHHLVERHGPERARAAHEAVASSVIEIGEFCSEHGIDADYERNGLASLAFNDGQMWRLQRDLEAARSMGADDFTLLEGEEARSVIGSPVLKGLLREGRSALLNPHKLVRGLARTIEEMGVRIFERSPATEVSSGRVATELGAVEAERIVVATNAYQHTLPQFRGKVVPIWSYAMVTEPLSDEQLGRVEWPGREGFEDKRNFITIGRFAADNRVIFGGRLAPYFYGSDMDTRHMRNEHVFEQLRGAWREFFPMWGDVRFTHAYGGCVAITGTFLPYVGSVGDGIWYGYGYNGHGVAPSHTVGRTLCDLVLERDTEHTGLVFVNQANEPRVPPEPLRFLGTRLTMALLERQDRRMDRGGGVGEMDPILLRVVNRLS
jgi:glycine/D-amino acid oxidase-like deaminating enzyme